MTTPRCCGAVRTDPGRATTAAPAAGAGGRRPTLTGRCLEAAGWVVPGVLLAVLPKCPACLAAYVAVGTGVGLSVTAAGCLWLSLAALCAGALGFLAARRARRLIGVLSPAKEV